MHFTLKSSIRSVACLCVHAMFAFANVKNTTVVRPRIHVPMFISTEKSINNKKGGHIDNATLHDNKSSHPDRYQPRSTYRSHKKKLA